MRYLFCSNINRIIRSDKKLWIKLVLKSTKLQNVVKNIFSCWLQYVSCDMKTNNVDVTMLSVTLFFFFWPQTVIILLLRSELHHHARNFLQSLRLTFAPFFVATLTSALQAIEGSMVPSSGAYSAIWNTDGSRRGNFFCASWGSRTSLGISNAFPSVWSLMYSCVRTCSENCHWVRRLFGLWKRMLSYQIILIWISIVSHRNRIFSWNRNRTFLHLGPSFGRTLPKEKPKFGSDTNFQQQLLGKFELVKNIRCFFLHQ